MCALARSKGILSAVDGAHVVGMMRLDVKDLGCDMYTSSPHKWLQAPKGTGFFYVRDEVMDRLWNTIATSGWDEPKLRAERFQRIGSSNVPALWGLRAAIELAETIGLDRIEKRHRQSVRFAPGRDGEARRAVLDLTGSRPALRDRHRQRAPHRAHGAGEVDVDAPQDPHPRWASRRSCASPRRITCCRATWTGSWERFDDYSQGRRT
jgi:hypothetical protein